VESLRKEVESEMELLKQAAETPYEKISNGNLTAKDWKRAEQNRGLGYDGHASRGNNDGDCSHHLTML
jgi:hypothetical protein